MQADAGLPINHLRVDGGAAANDLLMQIEADLLGVQIFRPEMVESTALGAAKLAALGIGLPPAEKGGETARMRMFTPTMPRRGAPRCSQLGGSRRARVTGRQIGRPARATMRAGALPREKLVKRG